MTVQVRPAVEADAAGIAAVYRPYVEATAVSFEAEPPDEAEVRRRMTGSPRLPWLVAVDDDRVVGYAYATQHRPRAAYRWTVECSVYLAASAVGQGTGRRLYEELLDELRRLGHVTALGIIALPNPPSVRLHEAMGFVPVGVLRRVGHKLGEWRDVGWWQLSLRAVDGQPAEPQEWEP